MKICVGQGLWGRGVEPPSLASCTLLLAPLVFTNQEAHPTTSSCVYGNFIM